MGDDGRVLTSLEITSAMPETGLLDLPWELPLEQWPEDRIAALPRGISRHIVRFVRISGRVYAIKETNEPIARREYQMLRNLHRLNIPAVESAAVVAGRHTPDGEELQAALVTRHLQFSLPYRSLFSQMLRPDTATRLIDALAVLLVRVHLAGFYWGDVSLSNTLFRRDAGSFAAYLVDAETGELHERLSDGQRSYDLELARVNVAGEMLDLQAGDLLDEDFDAVSTASMIVERYESLWTELTLAESFDYGERWRVDARIRRLNQLGFDVGELAITTDYTGTFVQLQPKVVDAGHHSRRLLRLTGLDAEENQARRLLNDMDSFAAATDRQGEDEDVVAHLWLSEVFEPVVRAMPPGSRRKLQAPEVFHEVLQHRWYASERAGYDVGLEQAVRSYMADVLVHRRDEKAVLGGDDTEPIPIVSS